PGAVVSGGNIEGGLQPDIVDVDQGVTVTLRNLSFRLASSEGAAIWVGGNLKLEDSELSQNASSAVVVVDDGATLSATNPTIAGNTGGAVDVFRSASLVNVTVADNTLAGVFNESGGDVSLTNSIVARNGNGSTYFRDCSGAIATRNSFDGDGSCNAD